MAKIDWGILGRPPDAAPHSSRRDRYNVEQLAELDRLWEPVVPSRDGLEKRDGFKSLGKGLKNFASAWGAYAKAEEDFRKLNESTPVAPFVPGNRAAFRRGRRSGRDSLRIPLSSPSPSSSASSFRSGATGLNIPL